MGPWKKLRAYGEEMEKRLRLKTHPLAIKFLTSLKEVPQEAKRPLRDFGYHLSTCQAFAMSRRGGMTIASSKEDMWCPEPVIGYGIEKGLDYLLENHVGYPGIFETEEACRRWHRSLPHLEPGMFVGMVAAPLTKVNFQPEVILIYCDPAQLTQLSIAAHWQEGQSISGPISAHTACVWAVVPPRQQKKYQISLPCYGDRRRAMAQDDEMIFSLPEEKLEDLLSGLRHRDEHGFGFPYPFTMMPEYPLPDFYVPLAKKLGIKGVDKSTARKSSGKRQEKKR
jgi:uncharacterized protein (DUF169 family)